MARRRGSPREVWFRWRGFVSLFAAMLFIGATFSGVLLYAGPAGRTARRLEWDFLGLDRHQWWMVHCVHSLIFCIIIGFHIYFNWRPLLHHAKQTFARLRWMQRELLAATLLTALVTAGSAIEFTPFDYMLRVQQVIREWWADQPTPPAPTASFERDGAITGDSAGISDDG